MSKIYVAFQSTGHRIASGSTATIRDRLKAFPETQWGLYLYDFKPNVDTLAMLVEGDLAKWGTPKLIEHLRVNASNQVRKFDPTKTMTT